MQSLRTHFCLLVLLKGLLQSQKARRTGAQCQEAASLETVCTDLTSADVAPCTDLLVSVAWI